MNHRFCMSAIVSIMIGIGCFSSNAMPNPAILMQQINSERNNICKLVFVLREDNNRRLEYIQRHRACVPQMTKEFSDIDLLTLLSGALFSKDDKETCRKYGISGIICNELQSKGIFNYNGLAGITDVASLEAACEAAAKMVESTDDYTSVLQCIAYIAESVEHGTLLNTYGESDFTPSAIVSPLSGVYDDYRIAIGTLILAMPHKEKFIPLITNEQINTEAAKFGIDITKPNGKYQIVNDVVAQYYKVSKMSTEDAFLDGIGLLPETIIGGGTHQWNTILCATISNGTNSYIIFAQKYPQESGIDHAIAYTIDSSSKKLAQATIPLPSGKMPRLVALGNSIVLFGQEDGGIGYYRIDNQGKLVGTSAEGIIEGDCYTLGCISDNNGKEYAVLAGGKGLSDVIKAYTFDADGNLTIVDTSGISHLSWPRTNFTCGALSNGRKSFIAFAGGGVESGMDMDMVTTCIDVFSFDVENKLIKISSENNGGIEPAELSVAKNRPVAGRLGKYLMFIGGDEMSYQHSKSIDVYTISGEGHFIKVTENLPEPLSELSGPNLSCCNLSKGNSQYLLLFGGGSTIVEGYTIDKNDMLTKISNDELPELSVARSDIAAGVIDGKLIMAGGWRDKIDADAGTSEHLGSIDVFTLTPEQ